MIPETLAEVVFLALLAWAIYRALAPARRRMERALLRWLDPSRADVVDAELIPRERRKNHKE